MMKSLVDPYGLEKFSKKRSENYLKDKNCSKDSSTCSDRYSVVCSLLGVERSQYGECTASKETRETENDKRQKPYSRLYCLWFKPFSITILKLIHHCAITFTGLFLLFRFTFHFCLLLWILSKFVFASSLTRSQSHCWLVISPADSCVFLLGFFGLLFVLIVPYQARMISLDILGLLMR